MNRNGGAIKTSSDKMHEKYKDLDFADAKSVSETPHHAQNNCASVSAGSGVGFDFRLFATEKAVS